MRLQDNIDYTTLGWVKPELDETLRQARLALEEFVESPDDMARMRECAGYLHQVQGTLRMVELYGAAMVAEEMEQLARAALAGGLRDADDAYSVLMRGIVQLPDYLERLQSGHKDIPIVLLPLLNDLRASRGEQGVNESVLFSPDLGRPLPDSAMGPLRPLADEAMRVQAEGLRAQYQAALLNWLKDDHNPETISALGQVCERLVPLVQAEGGRRLFWVAAGTLGALQAGAFEADRALKQALARVEREIKRLAEQGERAFRDDPPLELTRQLLYFVAHAPTEHARIGEMRQVFGLDRYVPTQSELSHAQGSMTGHNRALLDTVSSAIKEDLMRVKDALDLHLRNPGAPPEDLGPQVEVLDRVGDTLGMLGLGVPRRVVQEQRDAISNVAGRQRPADESTLLDIAGALLYVEASLDDQVMRLGQQTEAPAEVQAEDIQPLPSADAQRLLETLAKEAIANFAQARQCFVAYVETSWDAAQLQDVPRLLEEVGGVLRMLELPEPADYVESVRRFTAAELLQHRRVPNARQLDTLADALASLEYYLEALRDHRGQRERILDIARESLASLGYWPLPAADAVLPEHPADRAPTGAPEFAAPAPDTQAQAPAPAPEAPPAVDLPSQLPPEIERAIAEAAGETGGALYQEMTAPVIDTPLAPAASAPSTAPAATVSHGAGGFEGGSDDIDDEIREVFLEEFTEEIENLDQLLPEWRANPANLELLRPIRRVFHTLKGSGRLVGALTLGEFSWKVENMLNRVLDESRPASPAVVALVQAAHDRLPQLHGVLQGQASVPADLDELKALADRVAAGAEEFLPSAVPAEAPVAVEPAVVEMPEAVAEVPVVEAVESRAEDAPVEPVVAVEAAAPVEAAIPEPAIDLDLQAPVSVPADGVPAAVDSVLLEILKAEVHGHLDTVAEWLASAGGHPVQPTDPLLRAVHTMNGAFAMTEVPLVPELTSPLEGYIKRLIAARAKPSRQGMELIREAHGALRGVLVTLEAAEPYVALMGDLPDRVAAERDTLPEPSRPTLSVQADVDETEAPINVVVIDEADTSGIPDFEAPTELLQPSATPQAAVQPPSAEAPVEPIDEARAAVDVAGADEAVSREVTVEASSEGTVEAVQAPPALDDSGLEPAAPSLSDEVDALAQDAFNAGLVESVPVPAQDAEAVELDPSQDAALAALLASYERAAQDAVAAAPVDAVQAPVADEAIGSIEVVEGIEGIENIEGIEGIEGIEFAGIAESTESDEALDFDGSVPLGVVDEGSETAAPAEPAPVDLQLEETGIEVDASAIEAALGLLGEPTDALSQDATDAARTTDEAMRGLEAEAAGAEDAAAHVDEPAVGEGEAPVAIEPAELPALAEGDLGEAPVEPALSGDALEAVAAAEDIEAFADADAEAHAETAADDVEVTVEFLTSDDAAPEEARLAEGLGEGLSEVERAELAAAEEGGAEEGRVGEWAIEADVEPEPGAAVAEEGEEAEMASVASEESSIVFADLDPDPDGPLDVEGIDEDLLDIFLEEAHDLLDQSDGLLAELRQAPGERDYIVGLQRDLHTLKGGARMAGIHPVGELGHVMETLLEAVAEGRLELDRTGVRLLEHGFDRLHRMVSRVAERQAIALPAGLIEQVEAFSRGESLAPQAVASQDEPAIEIPAVPAVEMHEAEVPEQALEAPITEALEDLPSEAPRVEEVPVVEAAAADSTDLAEASAPETEPEPVPAARVPVELPAAARLLKPLSRPLEADALAEEDEPGAIRAPQEQVRIRADLLDRLVNYAGEVAIYRARLEQQLGSFRGNLGELEATTSRLREQLRKLDIETEAQIIARYQREQKEADSAFDPLELDRFSTLQQLSRALAESAADLVSLQEALDEHTRQYETLLLQQSRVSSDLQEGLMRTRMVPFDALVPRLRRVLRQAATETGKQVQIRIDGAQGEMDRNVLERMTAPLEHMLRNAVAHGLETPADRRKAGKAEEGTVRVAVHREGSEVVITVADDGRGLDPEAIRRKAIERGLLQAGVEVPEQALFAYIMEPGFSTAETVSRLAGRGVGMDVVHNEIRQLGGSLGIRSERGKGSEFTIRLPFTLAVTQAVFVKIGETSFAVPIASVRGVGRVGRAELEAQLAGEHPTYRYAGEDYTIHDLGVLLGHAPAKAADSLQMPLLLARSGDLRAAICIDQVLGSREIVVKPVGPQVASIPGIFGATVMGDGSVVVILDVAPLVRRHQAQAALQEKVPVVAEVPEEVRRVPLVMVVDDSITMRKVTGRVLERNNFEVMTAKDGVDAIEKMAERVPDLMLLDIEMPRMDGYELATHMRNEARLKDVPIVMITSRTGEKHRQRAFEIGVNRYLGKPYQEAELMRNVYDLLEGSDG